MRSALYRLPQDDALAGLGERRSGLYRRVAQRDQRVGGLQGPGDVECRTLFRRLALEQLGEFKFQSFGSDDDLDGSLLEDTAIAREPVHGRGRHVDLRHTSEVQDMRE